MAHIHNSAKQIRNLSAIVAVLVIIVTNVVCYSRSLSAYFLADDFVHVAFLADVFAGHPEKLLENFTGNWMHAWGTQFYRPFISLTLALDYAIGQGNSYVFHVSNLIYQIACSLLLFFIARRLTNGLLPQQQFAGSMAAALFFSLSPLHTEVVSWIIGRVDSVCLAFNLAAFYLYLRYRETRGIAFFTGSLMCFVISLISKEMAVILPPLIVLHEFFFGTHTKFTDRVKTAFWESRWYFATLAAYLGVRFLALGTLQGGYGGSIGDSLTNSLSSRLSSLSKLFFPFNLEAIPPAERLHKFVLNLYKFSAVLLLLRFVFLHRARAQLRLIFFAVAWTILALLPTYQVFNITDSLMCSRFAYFATAGLSLLFAFLLSPLWEIGEHERKQKKYVWGARVAFLLIGLWLAVFGVITMRNNIPWAHAGSQVRSFREAVADESKNAEKVIVLNVPHRLAGAHLIYNGAMLSVLLSKPLSDPPLMDRVINFEPATYGDPDLISISRLRRLAGTGKDKRKVLFWDMEKKKFVQISIAPAAPFDKAFDLTQINGGLTGMSDGYLTIESPPLNIDSSSVDFLVLKLKVEKNAVPEKMPIIMSWCGGNFPNFSDTARRLYMPLIADGEEHEYWFAVSEHKSWLACQNIDRIRLQIPSLQLNKDKVSFQSARFVSGETLVPKFEIKPGGGLGEGVDGINRPVSEPFSAIFDASKIPGCTSVVVELSKPNSWFEHYTGTMRDKELSKETAKSFKSSGSSLEVKLSKKDFPMKAYYELRGFALDEDGKVIGFASDPLVLQID
jgi:hypothetical protein